MDEEDYIKKFIDKGWVAGGAATASAGASGTTAGSGKGETMVAYCREGGLGDARISGQQAMDYANDRFQPLSRGLVIERSAQVERDNGTSATNAVTFNVAP